MSDSSGIDLVMTSGDFPSRQILDVNGGGVALFDYDGDGDLDVFLANGATSKDPEHGPGSRLYANRGDGTFIDVTVAVGLDLTRWAMGVAVGDYDGDGWDDLYVTCFGPNVLLRNDSDPRGGRRFVDVTQVAGVADPGWSTSAAFADLDRDGDLDLYVVNYLAFDPANPPAQGSRSFKGVSVMAGPRGLEAQSDTLFENLGDGHFRDVSVAALGELEPQYGLSVRSLDVDGDGRTDLFVGNDSTPDRLLHNLGGLRFRDVGLESGVATNGMGTPQATMGLGLFDADGNGLPDLFLTVFSDDGNTLHLNLGNGYFDDRSASFGLGPPSRPYLGWGCGFFDFDQDGDEDLLVANGHVHPEMETPEVGGEWAQRPLRFERRGSRFLEIPGGADWCGERYHGRATAFGDLDGDLDVDALMTTLAGPVVTLRNESNSPRGVVVALEGGGQSAREFGSSVALTSRQGTQRRWVTGGGSFQSVDSSEAHFAVTATDDYLRIDVIWGDGFSWRLTKAPLGRRLVVRRTRVPKSLP
ncbi:MAG: CRTAC1 family protein [Thermoanaerobaculia bacterium]|nr:CRTAC1 family protein [Thermoanaerobaculia bacterium]